MPNALSDVAADVPVDNSIRLQLIGTLISAVAYGLVVSLFIHCLSLLIFNKGHSYTRRTRSVLIAYVVVMFSLSTASAIQSFVYITKAIFNGIDSVSQNIININEPIFLPPAILGADGLLLWRFVILYRNASWRIFVYCALFSTSMGSLVFAVLYYFPPQVSESAFGFQSPLTVSVVTIALTTCMNFIRASMITGRLLYHQETMRKIMGKQYGSPYLRIIVMIVESCCPIIITGIAYLILVKGASVNTLNGGIIPLLLFPHVCVASPLLIVYQVARERIITSLRPLDIVTPNIFGMDEDCMGPIQFRRTTTTVLDPENTPSTCRDSDFEVRVSTLSEKVPDRPRSQNSNIPPVPPV